MAIVYRNEFLNNLHKRHHNLIITIGNLELKDTFCDSEVPLQIVIDKGEYVVSIADFVLNRSEQGYHLEYIGDRPLGVNPRHFWALIKYGYALLEAGYPNWNKGD